MDSPKNKVINNNNNFKSDTMQQGEEDFIRTAFEYSFPTNDDDDTESNKSTPYFTPMEFLQSPFEFPTPRLVDTEKINSSSTLTTITATAVTTSTSTYVSQPTSSEIDNLQIMMQTKDLEIDKHSPRIMQSCSKSIIKHLEPSSPNFQRKFRRFSLYERRSCSPQHLILKNASSVECTVDTDKENTRPKFKTDKNDESSGGNNSPSIVIDETGSPRILTSSEAAMLSSGRLTYSPKLLTSINNINLASPLGVISSAGYKNGNYFKFPEIDHVVQDVQVQQVTSTIVDDSSTSNRDNQMLKCLGTKNALTMDTGIIGADATAMPVRDLSSTTPILPKSETKRNRKNKNNLTIKIINNSTSSGAVQPQHYFNTTTAKGKLPSSPSSNKPKTPTIKSTKEKALSLDSAPKAKDCVKATLLKPELNLSCDEIDSSLHENKQTSQSHDRVRTNVPSSRSTSLSHIGAHNHNVIAKMNKAVIRRRIPTSTSVDWQLHQRKHTLFNIPDITKKMCENRDDKTVVVLKEEDLTDSQSSVSGLQTPGSVNCASNPSTHRGSFKHNPILHNSNTNLKTLPEFLTLVEFSTPNGGHADTPFKQKSMDLPSATSTNAPVKTPNPSSSSTNLLQRRGSNHSLTLNLHGSCSNLLGSCRSGLSVSNYSLGSVGNSTSNLNSKSSCNLNITASQNAQTTIATTTNTTQVAKQSLFRRRGSNQSLTLTNLTATSCGNLNSFASQNSLNVERAQLTILPRPIANASSGATPRRGLLERRGSNQSLTLNMSSSFGGIGSEKGILGNSSMNLGETKAEEEFKPSHQPLVSNCSIHSHQRRFFSSESLNRNNAQFSDFNQTHKRNSNKVCFGSVTDLKPNERDSSIQVGGGAGAKAAPEHFDFQESSVCTCSNVRNIMTKPLSPQTTSEEFKIYLANIQMLQNASNVLNQNDLIKLNYIFDNSYATNSKSIAEQTIPILNMPASNKEAETPPPIVTNSEDCEIVERYLHVVKHILQTLQLDDEEQKRVFRSLHKEFWDLPLNHQEKPMVFGSQTKNRYKTILPNENSRVILEKESKQVIEMLKNCSDIEEDLISEITKQISTSDEVPYINANYIKGPDCTSKCYVATQGPLPNTIYEFWLMIYQNTKKYIEISKGPESPSCRQGKSLQQYYQKIIMLTNFMENNRQKCSVYFPVNLNEIFISTSRDEVVEPSDKFRNFINTILESSSEEDDFKLSKAKCSGESVHMITMDTIKVQLEIQLDNWLPQCSSFFVIKNVGIVRKNGFSIRKLIILYCAKFVECGDHLLINKFLAYHYWYPDWPDHRSPRDINTLLDISLHIMNLGKCEAEFEVFRDADSSPSSHINAQLIELYQQDIFNAVQPLPVIHCSAGIGRTGCMTAILNGIRQVRQTLAYSLTSMATNAAKQASACQALSPVDFRLPKQFLEEDSILASPLPTDIDCSFTRNTLLYIRYILKMEQEINEQSNTSPECVKHVDTSCALPSLSELPKMSNIFVDVLGIVCNLRLQRGGMVQNSEQYELIHRAICLYLKRTFALKRF